MSEPSSSQPTRKTAFIIGAGASKEAGLPIGSELKNSIAAALDIRFARFNQLVSGNDQIFEALRMMAAKESTDNNLLRSFHMAGWHIRDAMSQAISIDHFLDAHGGDNTINLCGKLAIVTTILEAEAASSMFVDHREGTPRIEFGRLETTWFHGFMQLLTENCKAADLATRLHSIALIIFNYDRCFEHYLYYAIQNYYRMKAEDVAKLLQGLEIYHPYGAVGSLPWLSPDNAILFGASTHAKRLLELASEIKTFTEVTHESLKDVSSIRSIMETSPKLIFLGFAFHKMNVQLLLPKAISGTRRVFATGFQMSRSNTDFISADLASRLSLAGGDIKIHDLTCSRLIHEH